MKSEKKILVAFLLNLVFSLFEFFGGIITGSVAILSDAIHDIGDAFSIGVAFLLERKSKQPPDNRYTYGYAGYTVIGGTATNLILLIGSGAVIVNAIKRLIHPITIHYDGMIIFAIFGVLVNLVAAYMTHGKGSLNQKAINLHMLEDVLGWLVVLVGAVVMRFTDFALIDPLMSIAVAIYILYHAVSNLIEIGNLVLGKVPDGITVEAVEGALLKIEGVSDVHHIHLWSPDGQTHYATLHLVSEQDVKEQAREALEHLGIHHTTIETESPSQHCHHRHCHRQTDTHHHHHHHH